MCIFEYFCWLLVCIIYLLSFFMFAPAFDYKITNFFELFLTPWPLKKSFVVVMILNLFCAKHWAEFVQRMCYDIIKLLVDVLYTPELRDIKRVECKQNCYYIAHLFVDKCTTLIVGNITSSLTICHVIHDWFKKILLAFRRIPLEVCWCIGKEFDYKHSRFSVQLSLKEISEQ